MVIEDTDDRDVAQLGQQQESLLLKSQLRQAANWRWVCPEALLTQGLALFCGFSSQQLPVVTSSTIVRCRSCRTYINPFVSFLDQRRWKCNLCYRVNDGKIICKSCCQGEHQRQSTKQIQLSNKITNLFINYVLTLVHILTFMTVDLTLVMIVLLIFPSHKELHTKYSELFNTRCFVCV